MLTKVTLNSFTRNVLFLVRSASIICCSNQVVLHDKFHIKLSRFLQAKINSNYHTLAFIIRAAETFCASETVLTKMEHNNLHESRIYCRNVPLDAISLQVDLLNWKLSVDSRFQPTDPSNPPQEQNSKWLKMLFLPPVSWHSSPTDSSQSVTQPLMSEL